MIYISEFQNKLAWKFDTSVSYNVRLSIKKPSTADSRRHWAVPARSLVRLYSRISHRLVSSEFRLSMGVVENGQNDNAGRGNDLHVHRPAEKQVVKSLLFSWARVTKMSGRAESVCV